MAAALGDITYRAASVWKRLVGNVSTTRKFLSQTGSGAASAAPSWDQVTDADLSTSDITTNDVSTSKHGFAPKAPNDSTKFLNGVGGYSVPLGGVINVTFIRKTSNQTVTSSIVPVDDSELTFAIDANTTWVVNYSLLLDANTTSDFRFAVAAPSGATGWQGGVRLTDSASGTANQGANWSATTTLGDSGARFLGGAGAGVVFASPFQALIVNGANAGSITLRWAQEVSGGVGAIVMAGSFLMAYRVG